MPLDLFRPVAPPERWHPNFRRTVEETDGGIRAVLSDWADGFVDRDGKFVREFQETFNSSFWELYLHAVLKSLAFRVYFSHAAPDFVCPDVKLAVEATIASHARDSTAEWEKTLPDLVRSDLDSRYLKSMARLSNAIDGKVRKVRDSYAKLPHMQGLSYVIAIANFGTPDFHMLGDVAMQRLLYDVWEEGHCARGQRAQPPARLANRGISAPHLRRPRRAHPRRAEGRALCRGRPLPPGVHLHRRRHADLYAGVRGREDHGALALRSGFHRRARTRLPGTLLLFREPPAASAARTATRRAK
jgi:hypothetical protein